MENLGKHYLCDNTQYIKSIVKANSSSDMTEEDLIGHMKYVQYSSTNI